MKVMNKISYICAYTILALLLGACSYSELPPKTDDAADKYVLPAGVLPSSDEKALQQEARTEYEQFLKAQEQ